MDESKSRVSSGVGVRLARAEDMAAIASIVNPYIANTAINFRTKLQTAEDWTKDWINTRDRYPWLVATMGRKIAGVAYASAWKPRNAYDWCTEVTVYVEMGLSGRGIGRALYSELLGLLDAQGYRTIMAVIALPNEASIKLHEAFGFKQVGTLRGVGYKLGEWRDIGLWERFKAEERGAPRQLLPVDAVAGKRG